MISRAELLQVKRIASRVNPRIKQWVSLSDRKGRLATHTTLAEGVRLVGEALEARLNPEPRILRPLTLIVSDSGANHPDAGRLFQQAEETGVERVNLADDCFDKISGLKNSDGIALVLEFDAEEAEPETLLQGRSKILVADGVQDPGNAGALARTALAAGCDACVFLEGADPRSPKFLRGTMGAAFRLPCLQASRETFVTVARSAGVRLLLAVSDASAKSFRDVDFSGSVAVVIGGEKGVSEDILGLECEMIHIPLHGDVESLNLAVAAGVILFEAERHWR